MKFYKSVAGFVLIIGVFFIGFGKFTDWRMNPRKVIIDRLPFPPKTIFRV